MSDSTINFHPHAIPISNTDVDSSINEEKKYKDKWNRHIIRPILSIPTTHMLHHIYIINEWKCFLKFIKKKPILSCLTNYWEIVQYKYSSYWIENMKKKKKINFMNVLLCYKKERNKVSKNLEQVLRKIIKQIIS